jgi:hypothetical protein
MTGCIAETGGQTPALSCSQPFLPARDDVRWIIQARLANRKERALWHA